MNILLVGNGAREHVIAETLLRSRHSPKIYTFGKDKNPALFAMSEDYLLGDIMDFSLIPDFIRDKNIDFAFIGPENPIGAGIVDFLAKLGIPTAAPSQKTAQLEASKSFTRNLLNKYQIPGNPHYKVFRDAELIRDYVVNEIQGEFVVKADFLMGGKGVQVQGDHFDSIDEGIEIAHGYIQKSGEVVIEEKLVGQEFSLMSFADGKTVIDMPAAQDHKRAYEADKGPNTGGMGSYSYPEMLPFLESKDLEDAHNITQEVMLALEKECGEQYKGIMYGGFMITKNGVRLIEYNARFGDPEVMNVLPVLESDFVDICLAIIEQKLDSIEMKFQKKATVCKYLVPEGYPDNPVKNVPIHVDETYDTQAKRYYASVDERDGQLYLGGSRSLAYVGIADTVEEAEKIAEDAINNSVEGPLFHRKDIGTQALIQERIDMVRSFKS